MIDVIIVNWNAGQQLLECVQSVIANGAGLVAKIIVVDNDSHDGSELPFLAMAQVHLIRAGANLGFGKACNLGAANSTADFLLFLNPDAQIGPKTLSRVDAFMQSDAAKKVGIVGVQLLEGSQHVARSCSRFPTPLSMISRASGIDLVFPRLGSAMAEWDHKTTREVDHVIGAFYLIRRACFERAGGFDERFFVYIEDLDLSFRAKMSGWKTIYLADVQAFHAGGGTSSQVKAHRLFYSQRSRLQYAFKHFTIGGSLAVLLATLILEPPARILQAALRGSIQGVGEIARAYGWLWRWLIKGCKPGP